MMGGKGEENVEEKLVATTRFGCRGFFNCSVKVHDTKSVSWLPTRSAPGRRSRNGYNRRLNHNKRTDETRKNIVPRKIASAHDMTYINVQSCTLPFTTHAIITATGTRTSPVIATTFTAVRQAKTMPAPRVTTEPVMRVGRNREIGRAHV